MQEITNFTMFKSWVDAAEDLDDAERLNWYDAIINYHFYGIEPTKETHSIVIVALFKSNKPVMDKSIARRKASQQNGHKGGRPKAKEHSDLMLEERKRKSDLMDKIVVGNASDEELSEYYKLSAGD